MVTRRGEGSSAGEVDETYERRRRTPGNGTARVAVIGTGLIGVGWTTLLLARGRLVDAWDPQDGFEATLRAAVRSLWPTLPDTPERVELALERLRAASSPEEAAAGASFVQENAPERADVKRELFARLDAAAPARAVIASSTSSLLLTPLQEGLAGAERFVLAHPFHPVYLLPLVELSGGAYTAPWALEAAEEHYRALGQRPVRLRREIEGHIAGRLSAALYREAVHLVAEGVASAEDVDEAFRSGPALRLAVFGPHLNYHLGGGAGGIRRYLETLGPTQERRWRTLGTPALDEALVERLVRETEAATGGRSIAELERERDEAIAAVRKALERAGGSDRG